MWIKYWFYREMLYLCLNLCGDKWVLQIDTDPPNWGTDQWLINKKLTQTEHLKFIHNSCSVVVLFMSFRCKEHTTKKGQHRIRMATLLQASSTFDTIAWHSVSRANNNNKWTKRSVCVVANFWPDDCDTKHWPASLNEWQSRAATTNRKSITMEQKNLVSSSSGWDSVRHVAT